MKITAPKGHRISWWVYGDGHQRIRPTNVMRGHWDYDATCSCGWDTKTGGAMLSYVRERVQDHKLECGGEIK